MTSKIFKYSPQFVRSSIENRPGLLKILDNISWLFFDKILRMGVGLLVGVWVARYLGPEKYGLLNFALAFVGLFGAIATLGLQGIMVRDIVRKAEDASVILGTGFLLRVLGGLTAFCLMLAVISYLRPDDVLVKTIVAIFGFMQVIKAKEVVKYWFESQVQSKFVVWVENSVFLVISGVKVAMILLNATLMAFVWAAFAEALLVAVLLFAVYGWKIGGLSTWKFDFKRAKTMLRDSWPLILSGIAVAIYLKIDQIMLGQMVGDEAVGVYSAAVRISEIWYFVPMAIVASVFPAIIEAKKKSEQLYYQRFQRLFDLMVWMAIAVALPLTFLSTWLVVLLFGQEYAQSGTVLAIHIWAALFVFLGVAGSRWYLTENRQILNLQRVSLGALSNVLLNYLMIPKYGVIGSAYATVISYFIADLFYDILQKETRQIFTMKIISFNLYRIIASKKN